MYIADSSNNRVRKVQSGIITTIAGTGVAMLSGDGGSATSASLNFPYGIALDSSSNVYIADAGNHCIRKITVSTGIMTTIAGTGYDRYTGDNGAATSAALNYPYGVSLDSVGNIYIADTNNHRIRKVTVSSGIMTTIAGTGISGYSGDNGVATSAALNYPYAVYVDSSGNVYIADTYNYRVRMVTASSSIMTTIAGTGIAGYTGDNGAASSASLNYPKAITLDSSGNMYVADTNNNIIRKISVSSSSTTNAPTMQPSTTSTKVPSMIPTPIPTAIPSSGSSGSVISTIAGTGTASFSGDGGVASSASINYPSGVAIDSSGT